MRVANQAMTIATASPARYALRGRYDVQAIDHLTTMIAPTPTIAARSNAAMPRAHISVPGIRRCEALGNPVAKVGSLAASHGRRVLRPLRASCEPASSELDIGGRSAARL